MTDIAFDGWIRLTDIAKLESPWISVEQKPPYRQEIIVYQPNWAGQQVTIAEYVGEDEKGHRFCFDFNTCLVDCYREDRHDFRYSVTHWKPLPEPPGGE